MSEEFLNQNSDQKMLSDVEVQKRRNVANNANNVRAAAEFASKTSNPYAKAAGIAVKGADKISGGKSSESLGKALNSANKFSPGGRLTQMALNKMNESGTTNRIANAVNKKNSSNLFNKFNSQKNNLNNKNDDLNNSSSPNDDQDTGEGFANFKVPKKIINIALISSIVSLGAIVFVCLLVAGPQTYLNSITLGNADATSDEIDKIIDRATEEDLNEQITDERLENTTGYNYNVTIKRSTYSAPYILNNWTKKKRKYNEADLAELEDFYGSHLSYNDETAYDFYYKLHDIYVRYSSVYNVELDLTLLMSTLMLESKDISVIFESNTSDDNYDYNDNAITSKSNNHILDYHYDWASKKYLISSENSAHDIEILAQNMVSIDSNGKYVIDEDKYKEFLKEFLEKKYFIEGGGLYEGQADNNFSKSTCPTETPFTKYNLTDEQLKQIASLAYHEQGNVRGAAAEASLMANLFELRGSKYGEGAEGLYNYVRNSGWFANSEQFMDIKDASEEIVNAVKSVLVDGKRTLPAYIDEHDMLGDITSAKTDGKVISVADKSLYVQYKTQLTNRYGSSYTFYSFPDTNSDPFGYTSEKIREEKGEFHYDFETGEPKNCKISSSVGSDLSSAFVSLAVAQLKDPSKDGGKKYWQFMGFNSKVAWCASFVSWNIFNTEYNGQKLGDIVNKKTASVDGFMNFFHDNANPNINFYYNDNCSTYKDRNGKGSTYIPKEGDLIFFDNNSRWNGSFPVSRSNLPNRHVGIVQYAKDGQVVTIEGNSGDKVKENKFSLSSCKIIGFGSWY